MPITQDRLIDLIEIATTQRDKANKARNQLNRIKVGYESARLKRNTEDLCDVIEALFLIIDEAITLPTEFIEILIREREHFRHSFQKNNYLREASKRHRLKRLGIIKTAAAETELNEIFSLESPEKRGISPTEQLLPLNFERSEVGQDQPPDPIQIHLDDPLPTLVVACCTNWQTGEMCLDCPLRTEPESAGESKGRNLPNRPIRLKKKR